MATLQPMLSPSEHSLFSVRLLSSSSSSLLSQNEKLGLNLGNKLKKALSRSSSLKESDPISHKDRKNLILNPVPLTHIPVRKGSVDLKYQVFDNRSLQADENYYFRHNKTTSIEESIIEEDESNEFYFSDRSPFDVIFNDESSLVDLEPPLLPVAPLRIRDKRVSNASTIKLNRNSASYRSSRITINTSRSKLTMLSSPKLPEFALFSPDREAFGVPSMPQSHLGRSCHTRDLRHGQMLGEREKKAEGEWSYEEKDMYSANELAEKILGMVGEGLMNSRLSWI